MAVDDSYTKSLLHGNGVDGGTVFTDEAGNTWEIQNGAYATIETDTDIKKFGTASIHKTGQTAGSVASLRMTSGLTAGMNPGSGDFTVDFQMQWNPFPTWNGGSQTFLAIYGDSNNKLYLEIGICDNESPYYYFMLNGKASGVSIGYNYFGYNEPSFAPVAGQMYHIELCRTGNDYEIFIEGTLLETVSIADHTFAFPSGAGTYIDLFNSTIQGHDVWFDEFRYSVGIARHTSNFTPPAAAYGPVEYEVNGNLSIPLSVGSYFMEGDYGDLRAHLAIPLGLSGTLDTDAITINVSLALPLSMSGIITSFDNEIRSPIAIPLSMRGTMYSHAVIDGYLYKALPALTLAAEGYINPTGEANIVLPSLRLSAEGSITISGELAKSLPMITLSASGFLSPIGIANLTLPMLTLNGLNLAEIIGTGAVEIPIFRISANGYSSVEGSANVTIPMLTLYARVAEVIFDSMVLNLKTTGLTVFENYLFNSMCHFQGKNLGATATGINDLDLGTTDNGAIIDWNFKIGHIDLHLKTKKKLRQAWLSCQISGNLIVTVITTDGEEYEYNATSYAATEDGVRVKFGKGIRSKYVSLDVKNDEASAIELDAIRLNLDKCGGMR